MCTYTRSWKTRETTLSTLSGGTYNTTLSVDTWGSRQTSGTLMREMWWSVTEHVNVNRSINSRGCWWTLETIFCTLSSHSQGHHQNQVIPSLQGFQEDQQHQPHQDDQQHQSHHGLLFVHLYQRVRRVQGVQQLPGIRKGGFRGGLLMLDCWRCYWWYSQRGRGVQLCQRVQGNQ